MKVFSQLIGVCFILFWYSSGNAQSITEPFFTDLKAKLKRSQVNFNQKSLGEIKNQILTTREDYLSGNENRKSEVKCLMIGYLDKFFEESNSACEEFIESIIKDESPEKRLSAFFPLKDKLDSKWRENFYFHSKPILNSPLSSIGRNVLNGQDKKNPKRVARRALFCADQFIQNTKPSDVCDKTSNVSEKTSALFKNLIKKESNPNAIAYKKKSNQN